MSGSGGAQPIDFPSVKARLAEIAEAVEDDSLPLDEALDLYEEAVALGLQASDLLEIGIDDEEGAEGDGATAGDAAGAAGAAGADAESPREQA